MGVDKSIDITPSQKEAILGLLKQHLPNTTVWVYGSRVNQTARPNSDLDMVAFVNKDQQLAFYDLKEAFDESDLPFRVDLFIWDEIPEQFHGNIKSGYVVLQEGLGDGSEWPVITLEELSSNVAYGYTESASSEKVGPHFLRITDIQNGTVNWNNVPYCPISESDHLKYKLKGGDIVVARTGNSTGENYIFSGDYDAVFASYLIRFRIDELKSYPKYVWYTMRSAQWWGFINNSKTGSAQAGANAKVLGRYPIHIPPLPEQKAIAHILGSLDDKIELNRQMNVTLESMAQALFKSWFVDFDPVIDNAIKAGNEIPDVFAVRAELRRSTKQLTSPKNGDITELTVSKNETASSLKTGGVDANNEINPLFPSEFEYTEEMGWIPKGWGVVKLNELIDVKYGKDHKKLNDGTIPVYGSGGVMRFVDQSLYIGESVLIPRKGTLSNLMYVDEEFWSVDTMFYSVPKSKFIMKYVFYHLKTFDFVSMNVGSAVPSMTTKVLNDIHSLKPNNELLKRFDNLISVYFNKKQSLEKNNQVLTKLRDTLLPKLISGELRIPDAEKLIKDIL